jgi:hypothetical protein
MARLPRAQQLRLVAVAVALSVALVDGVNVPVVIRAVDDVAPALRNATSSALSGAEMVVRQYQDVLFAIAMRMFFLKNSLLVAAALSGSALNDSDIYIVPPVRIPVSEQR